MKDFKHSTTIKIISTCLIITIGSFFVLPAQALAGRGRAGGAKMAEFDTGQYFTSVGIALGGALITAGLAGAWSSATNAANSASATSQIGQNASTIGGAGSKIGDIGAKIGNTAKTIGELASTPSHFLTGFSKLGDLTVTIPALTKGFAAFSASTQLTKAVQYYGLRMDWKPKKTYLVSTIVSSIGTALVNPDIALGKDFVGTTASSAFAKNTVQQLSYSSLPTVLLKAAAVGALEGTAKGFVITAIDGSKINDGESPGALAQVAGMAAGMAAGSFGREIFYPEPRAIKSVREEKIKEVHFDPSGNARNIGPDGKYNFGQSTSPTQELDDILNFDPLGNSNPYKDLTLEQARNLPEFWGLKDSNIQQILQDPDHYYIKETTVYKDLRTGAQVPLENYAKAGHYKTDFVGHDTYVISDMRPSANPFKAAVNHSIGEWPTLATQFLSLKAKESLGEKKKYLEPLVGALTEGIAGPIIGNLAEAYNLYPKVMNKGERLADRLQYNYKVEKQIESQRSAEFGKGSSKLYFAYRDKLANPDGSINQAQFDEFEQKLKELAAKEGFNDIGAITGKTAFEEIKKDALANLAPGTDAYIKAEQTFNDIEKKGSFDDNPVMMLNMARMRVANQLENKMAATYKTTYDTNLAKEGPVGAAKAALKESLRVANVSRGQALGVKIWDDMRYKVFTGAISGGLESVFAKNTDENTPVASKMLVSYAANMVSGALHGIAWNKSKLFDSGDFINYSEITKPEFPDNPLTSGPDKNPEELRQQAAQELQQELEAKDIEADKAKRIGIDMLAGTGMSLKEARDMGERMAALPSAYTPTYDVDSSTVSQKDIMSYLTAASNYDRQLDGFYKVMALTGTRPSTETRGTGANQKEVTSIKLAIDTYKDANGVERALRPSLGTAIMYGMAQGGASAFVNAFSFGHPLKRAELASISDFVQFTDIVQQAASTANQKGLGVTLANAYAKANVGAAGTNLQGIAANSAFLSKNFNLAPERFVGVRGSHGKIFYTVQQMSHIGSQGITRAGLLVPFPNPNYKVMADTGSTGRYLWREANETPIYRKPDDSASNAPLDPGSSFTMGSGGASIPDININTPNNGSTNNIEPAPSIQAPSVSVGPGTTLERKFTPIGGNVD